MIRVKYTSDTVGWATEKHLEELNKNLDAHNVSWFKRLKTLLKGKAEEPTKPNK